MGAGSQVIQGMIIKEGLFITRFLANDQFRCTKSISCPSISAQRSRALSTTAGEKDCVIAAIPSTSDQSLFPSRVRRALLDAEGDLRVAVGEPLGVGLGLILGL